MDWLTLANYNLLWSVVALLALTMLYVVWKISKRIDSLFIRADLLRNRIESNGRLIEALGIDLAALRDSININPPN